jgi:hypothetical protein
MTVEGTKGVIDALAVTVQLTLLAYSNLIYASAATGRIV